MKLLVKLNLVLLAVFVIALAATAQISWTLLERNARTEIEDTARLLMDAYGAPSHEWNTRLSESVLARLHYVLHVDPAQPHDVDVRALERQVAAAARAWVDDLD